MKCSGFERTQQSAQGMLVGLLDINSTDENTVRKEWYPIVHTFSPPPSIFDRILSLLFYFILFA